MYLLLWLLPASGLERLRDRLHRRPISRRTKTPREPLVSTGREPLLQVVGTESKENWPGALIGLFWERSEVRRLRSTTRGSRKNYDYRACCYQRIRFRGGSSAESVCALVWPILLRGRIGSGAEALILGFVIEGTGPIDILATAKVLTSPT